MPINLQKKAWEDILRKQYIEKVNTDLDEIDISRDDSDLEDKDHIEAIKEENPQISFAAALQMLDQLQDFASSFADTEMQCHLATLLKSYKTWDFNARNKLRLKTFSPEHFGCSWYIRFAYLYPKKLFLIFFTSYSASVIDG